MKKIKKLSVVHLKDEELSKIKGGYCGFSSCVYETCGEAFVANTSTNCQYVNYSTGSGSGSGGGSTGGGTGTVCGCGCAGCIVEDGGTGFSLGMMSSHLG